MTTLSRPGSLLQEAFRFNFEQTTAQKAFSGRLPIDVATMTDLDDHDDKIHVMDLVQNSVVPLSKTIMVVPREFLAARRPRVARQRRDRRDDPAAVRLRQGLDFLVGRRLDEESIACHDAGGPLRQPRNQGLAPWLCHETRRDRRRPLRDFAGARRLPDRKQTSQSLLPSSGPLDVGRHRGRWLPAWSSSYGQISVITSQRQRAVRLCHLPGPLEAGPAARTYAKQDLGWRLQGLRRSDELRAG